MFYPIPSVSLNKWKSGSVEFDHLDDDRHENEEDHQIRYLWVVPTQSHAGRRVLLPHTHVKIRLNHRECNKDPPTAPP